MERKSNYTLFDVAIKKCTKCGCEKPLSEFYRSKDGFRSICKICDSISQSDIRNERKKNGSYTNPVEKKCAHCGEIKPIELFYEDCTKVDGYKSWCKSCLKGRYYKPKTKDIMEEISRFEIITPDIAREYLKANKDNRVLNQRLIKQYAEIIKNGQWKANGETISFSKGGRLLNGQHRLNAVILAGKSIKINVARNIDDDCFATYDSGKNRTNADVFSISGIGDASTLSNIVNKTLNYLYLSDSNIVKGTKSPTSMKISKDDLLTEYYAHESIYNNARSLGCRLSGKLPIISKGEIGSIASYLVIYKHHDEEKVENFFKMFFGEIPSKYVMFAYVRNLLTKDKLSHIKMESSRKSAYIIKLWNQYIKGKDVKIIKINDDEKYSFL